jgi:hypothetical protein
MTGRWLDRRAAIGTAAAVGGLLGAALIRARPSFGADGPISFEKVPAAAKAAADKIAPGVT